MKDLGIDRIRMMMGGVDDLGLSQARARLGGDSLEVEAIMVKRMYEAKKREANRRGRGREEGEPFQDSFETNEYENSGRIAD